MTTRCGGLRRWTALLIVPSFLTLSCSSGIAQTTIEKWPDGHRAAVSVTYDGGTINQFKVARPIMNDLGLPATFFIVTGDIGGSQYQRTFIGRPVSEVAAEVVDGIPTTTENFFERAGAVRMLPFREAVDFHTRAGDLFELGKIPEAYAMIEDGFKQAARGLLTPVLPGGGQVNADVEATWEDLRVYASEGHEFASHSVSHAQHAILDDPNMLYELEKSREEILRFLGPEHTFSVEVPYGTENDRVMSKMLALYPASRNRMPDDFLDEINRWNSADPVASQREYVQWQRGPKSATPVEEMQSWIDTIVTRDNIWLVLVFHGVEGIGWEPKTAADLEAYFEYIAEQEDVWVATFRDVTRYMRQRMSAEVSSEFDGASLRVHLVHPLDPAVYDYPLTLRTPVPDAWTSVEVSQGNRTQAVSVSHDGAGPHVQYEAFPNEGTIVLWPIGE
ncbi:MAG: polysaccharide deacetylase family protein [Rhodothermales bacterium]|nr:polysaccharide deacetylase family protein [Rhodothermales bacterium]